MKIKRLVFVVFSLCILFPLPANEPVGFDHFFENATLRVDLIHIGDKTSELYAVDRMYKTPVWAGSPAHVIDTFNNGRYFIRVFDSVSGKLIFSRGFNSIFGEYATTKPAANGIKRAFPETALIPFPRNPVRLTISARNRDNSLKEIFRQEIDPKSVDILQLKKNEDVEIIPIAGNTNPHHSMDLAIVADGYTGAERNKAVSDAKYFAAKLLNMAPYNRYRNHINIALAFRPSPDSGCTEPTRGIYKRTAVNASFNSLGLPRYLLTEDNRDLRDIAGAVPYDIAVVMVNSPRYGGGGIYNFFCVFTADNPYRNYVFLHEFGHAFAGLADEYYSSAVTYDDFYPNGVEPLEPNITALIDSNHLKWKELASPGVSIPTSWGKAEYDSQNLDYQKKRRLLDGKIAKLTRDGASADQIRELKARAAKLSAQNGTWVNQFFANNPERDKVGAFEGAGYIPEGLYRPQLDCIMFSKGEKPFCKVCAAAIAARLRFYIE
ncbi:MAG: peptidase M64 [Acidobacteria bacterium CG_4_9_14_3_um_filter_49_7]|nr:MAG: peptidase M64 [Acidobacteria bacterium CG_4_9_14_3_um_filter_49_7]